MKKLLWMFVVVLLGACSILPKPAPPPALHDFGPPVSAAAADSVPVEASVSAPAWLDDTAIYYRLLYDNPTRLRVYADNRWLAPPAELLQTRLQAVFGNGSVHYRLQVRLLDFEQIFDTAQSAHISLRAVAEMQAMSTGKTIVQQLFAVTLPVSPDVQGAVSGDARAADELISQLVQWSLTQAGDQP